MAGVDQEIDARQIGAASQKVMNELVPSLDLALGGGGITVAWHIDEHELLPAGKKYQLLRAPWCVRGARERIASAQRIDQAGFADVGTAGEGDLGPVHRRQPLQGVGRGNELPVAREQLATGFDFFAGE